MDTVKNNIELETYTLYNSVMHDNFEGFEYIEKKNRIYCAKINDKGEKEWINWSKCEGYDFNSIRQGDIIMLQKMKAYQNRNLDKIYYKVISITKDKLVVQWADGDNTFTTYIKALKAPFPTEEQIQNESNFS